MRAACGRRAVHVTVACFGTLLAGHLAAAQTVVTHAASTANLDTTGAWVGGAVPIGGGSGSIALWDGTTTPAADAVGTITTGVGFAVNGIKITSPAGTVSINTTASGTGTLAIDSSGIDMSTATQNLTIAVPLTLTNSQTWNIAPSRVLTANSNIIVGSSNQTLTLSGTGTTAGTSNLLFNSSSGTTFATSNTNSSTGLAVNSITFASGTGAMTLSGGQITIDRYIGILNSSTSSQIIGNNLVLTPGASFGAAIATTGSTTSSITLNGVISGVAATDGVGVSYGSGATNGTIYVTNVSNSYAAQTSLDGGTLSINSIGNAGSGGVLSELGASSNASVNLHFETGALQYTGPTASTDRGFNIGRIGNPSAGTLDASGSGSLTIGGAFVNNNQSTTTTLGLTGTNTGANTLSSSTMLSDDITGATTALNSTLNVAKSGAGTWVLSAPNTYSGTTAISNGVLMLNNASALGAASTTSNATANVVGKGVASVTSTGVLDLNGQSISGQAISLSGSGSGSTGALINSSSSAATIGQGNAIGLLTVTANGSGTAANAGPLAVTVTGTGISGFTGVANIGLATLTGSGSGTLYTVAPTVNVSGGGGTGLTITTALSSGTVKYTITNPGTGYTSLPTLTLSGGTTTGTTATIAAATLGMQSVTVTNWGTATAGVFNGSGLTASIAATGLATSPTITQTPVAVNLAGNSTIGGAGTININVPVTGPAALTKTGAGVLSLNAANTYSGTTTISGGTLAIGGAGILTTSTIGVSGGELAGTGNVGTLNLSGSGVLSPGTGDGSSTDIGVLTSNNTVTATGGTYAARFNLSNGSTVGTGWSELLETGTSKNVALGNGLVTLSVIDVDGGASEVVGTAYPIISVTGGGTVSGYFAGLPTSGSTGTDASGDVYKVTYTSTADDITFTSLAPEPTSTSLILIGTAGLLSRRRRRALTVDRRM